jgi:cytochrome bd-type quinol oxidase subunit 1
LALASTLPVLWRVVLPIFDPASWPKHATHLVVLLVHAVGGLCMIILGAAALYIGWTRKLFRRHRWFVYGYLVIGGGRAQLPRL